MQSQRGDKCLENPVPWKLRCPVTWVGGRKGLGEDCIRVSGRACGRSPSTDTSSMISSVKGQLVCFCISQQPCILVSAERTQAGTSLVLESPGEKANLTKLIFLPFFPCPTAPCLGVSAPHPRVVQGSTAFLCLRLGRKLLEELELACFWRPSQAISSGKPFLP